MALTSYRSANPAATNLREIAEVLQNAMQGKLNIGGLVVLNGTQTVIEDNRIGAQSLLLFLALSAEAASIVPTIWALYRGKMTATLEHAAAVNAQVAYVVIG